jgi:hypothetical protein
MSKVKVKLSKILQSSEKYPEMHKEPYLKNQFKNLLTKIQLNTKRVQPLRINLGTY